jgi:hypothetical protein
MTDTFKENPSGILPLLRLSEPRPHLGRTPFRPSALAQESSQFSAVVVGRVCCVLQVAVGTLRARKRPFCCKLKATHLPEIKRGKKPKKNQSTPLTRDDDELFFG